MPNNLDYALVIGVEHYKEIQPLGGPHKDTKDFVSWLIDPAGGQLPDNGAWQQGATDESPSDNILLLLSTQAYTPVKDDVDDWFDSIMNHFQLNALQGRRLYFYFSGHGIGQTEMNSAMLLPKWTYSNRNYALSSEKYLQELVNKGAFQEIFFFMDCCRNRISGVQGQGPSWGAAIPSPVGTEYLTYYATEFDNPAYEVAQAKQDGKLDNLLPRGLFTEVLLKGLKGAAADRNGHLKVHDLVSYVGKELPKLAISQGKAQVPRSVIAFRDNQKDILGPFPKTIAVTIQFKTQGLDMVLEDPDLNEVCSGNTSEGQWQLPLSRGCYTLRKQQDTTGQTLFIDGLQTLFVYE